MIARERAIKAENDRIGDYRTIAISQVEQSRARVRSLKKQVVIANKQVERLQKLYEQGVTTRSKLEAEQSSIAQLQGKLEDAQAQEKEQTVLFKSIAVGRYFNGTRVEGQMEELKAALDFQWDKIMLAKDELLALERHRDRLTLDAPQQGRIVRLLKPEGSSVRSGEEIAIFERDEARVIEAFLTQEEAMEVGLGSEARIYFPSTDATVRAIIAEIDRTSGFIDVRTSAYKWRDPHARSARVILTIIEQDVSDIRKRFPPGLPVIVSFKREDPTDIRKRYSQITGGGARPSAEGHDSRPGMGI